MKSNFLLAAAFAALALPGFAQTDTDKPSEDVLADDLRKAVAAEFPAGETFDENVRQAFAKAMVDVADSLRASAIPSSARIAIIPIAGDRGNAVYGMLKTAIVSSGHVCVEDVSDPIWKAILSEAEVDIRNGGILDEKTLVKIGRLQSPDTILYGAVRSCSVSENRVFVELELHATDRASKRHVWGNLFAKRWYVPGTDIPKGISELATALRDQLKRVMTEKIVESLKAQPKLAQIRSVVLTPLVGDEDRYCTYIVRDGIVKTDLVAKELDLQSLQGARAIFRDMPVVAGDAVFYGAVRDLGWMTEPGALGLFTLFRVQADFQAAIERNDTHDVLWSDTIQTYEEFYIWNWTRIVLLAVAVVVVLLVLRAFLKAATRVR